MKRLAIVQNDQPLDRYGRQWTNEKYEQYCYLIKHDLTTEGVDSDDDTVYQIAKDTLRFEPGLETFMRSVMGVQDPVGRLADDI